MNRCRHVKQEPKLDQKVVACLFGVFSAEGQVYKYLMHNFHPTLILPNVT